MRWLLVAISFCGAVCTVSSLAVADEAEEPSLRVLTTNQGLLIYNLNETKGIFCEGRNLKHKSEWISPSGEPVPRRSVNKRVYAELRTNNTQQLIALFIKNITFEDSGNWTCKSSDGLSQTVIVYVVDKVNMTVKEVMEEGEENKKVKLICDAEGFPEPVIQWYKDNTIIEADPSKYVMKHRDHTHILEILNLSHLDPGTYTCRATQEKISHFDQKLFHLSVKHKPLMLNDEFTEREVYAIMDEIKNITCKARANPLPKYSWSKLDEKQFHHIVSDDQVYSSEDGSYSVLMLKVYSNDALGQYKCSVENNRGRENFIFDVSLGNKPDPPTSVKAVHFTAFNITFNVTCETCVFNVEGVMAVNPNNLTVLGYNFQLVPCQEGIAVPYWENATDFEFYVDNTTETTFTVTNLMNGTEYHARVATRNAAGLSDWLPVHPNPKTLEKNSVAALTVSLTLLIMGFFATCY